MPESEAHPRRVRFGAYELDEAAHELRKNGLSIHLQDQPWEVLRALLERPGEVVSREELRRRLWPDGTYVDYEQSLNKAVNKLREALCDSADKPRYVETVSRRGYRFVALAESDGAAEPRPQLVELSPRPVAPRKRALPWILAGGGVLAIVLATGLWPIDVPQVEKVVQLTNDTTLKTAGAFVSDGTRVLFTDATGAWWVPAAGGEPKRLPLPFLPPDHYPGVVGYAAIRRQILVVDGDDVWLVGAEGESPHKIGGLKPGEGIGGQIAITPDAERLAFVAPDGVYVQSVVSGARRKVHPAPPWWTPVVWHPSGHALGFTLPMGDTRESFRPWQVNDDGTHLRRIVPEREDVGWVGPWSQDGRRYFYIATGNEIYARIQPGILGWLRKSVIIRLTTSGQFTSNAPVVDPVNPKRLYAIGGLQRGQTERYDLKAHRWVPFLSGFSGEMIERSPDGQSMAYVPFPGDELHKCAIDGSGDIVLTPGVVAVNPRWSPDGKRIAFAGRLPDKIEGKHKLWLVSSGGGDAAPYRPEIAPITNAHWSPDGKRLLLGLEPDGAPQGKRVTILDLETGKLEPVPGSEKLWSPRWSPDGKRIMALAPDDKVLPYLFDAEKRVWRPLGKQGIGWNEWSRDGKYIYGMWFPHGKIEAYRIEVATGRSELVERTDFNIIGNVNWVGWTWDGEPLTIRDLSSTQIYRIDLDR